MCMDEYLNLFHGFECQGHGVFACNCLHFPFLLFSGVRRISWRCGPCIIRMQVVGECIPQLIDTVPLRTGTAVCLISYNFVCCHRAPCFVSACFCVTTGRSSEELASLRTSSSILCVLYISDYGPPVIRRCQLSCNYSDYRVTFIC